MVFLRNILCVLYLAVLGSVMLDTAAARSNVGLLRSGNNNAPEQRHLAWTSPEYRALFEEDSRSLLRELMGGSSLSMSMSMPISDPPSDVPSDVPSAAPSDLGSSAPTTSMEPSASPTTLPTTQPSSPPSSGQTSAPTDVDGVIPSIKGATSSAASGGSMGAAHVVSISVVCVAAVIIAVGLFVLLKRRNGASNSLESVASDSEANIFEDVPLEDH